MPAAYQDQNGKWWKECSSTKQLFGGVDTKEELGEWFHKNKSKTDGFNTANIEYTKIYLKEYRANNNKNKTKEYAKQYRQENLEKIKEQNKQYRQENSEKLKEYGQQYQKENSEKLKEYGQQYQKENSEKIKEIVKQYYQENLEKIKEYGKQYRQENSEKLKEQRKTPSGFLSHYKTSAKRRGINFTLTLEWFEEQMTKPEFNVCYYSGFSFVDEPNHPFSRSLDRINNEKGYSPDNVKWVCLKLNVWKSDLTLNEVAIMFKVMAKHHNVDPFEVLKKVA